MDDRIDVLQVPVRYAHGIDRRDWDLVERCFAPTAFVRGSRTQAALPDYLPDLRVGVEAFAVTTHFMGNQVVTRDGDVADCETYALAFHWHVDPEQNLLVSVRYLDTIERHEGGWRIAARTVEADWSLSGAQLPVPQLIVRTPG
jgi:hypothetical protein